MDDPLDWDVERVVRELCSPNRTWTPSSSLLKFPPLDQLEAQLRTHEVDGEVLLTYDHADLCAELGLKILKHKSSLKNAVQDIRLLSPKYRLRLKRQASDMDQDSQHAESADTLASEPSKHGSSVMEQEGERSLTHSTSHASREGPHLGAGAPTPVPKPDDLPLVAEEPALKKRRVVPMVLSTDVDPNILRNIPTEADVISAPNGPTQVLDDPTTLDSANQYLGKDAITRVEILDDTSYADMNLFQEHVLPRGRFLQLHRLMKRYLLRGQNYQSGLLVKSDVVPGADNPDHNEVLPLYGDSDEDCDSDTWKEVEAEEQARLAHPLRPQGLTTEEVSTIVDETIERIISDWKEYKLPKVMRTANRLWNEARRFGLKRRIEKVQHDLKDFEARIAKYREGFQGPGQKWRNAAELKQTTAILEQTLMDREYSTWLLSVLTSPNEPPRVTLPLKKSARKPRAPRPAVEDDEELLTTDSENGLDDFVVEDEDERGSPMDIVEDALPMQDDLVDEGDQSPIPVDLTQASGPGTPSQSHNFDVVDLTTPSKRISAPSTQPSSKGKRPANRLFSRSSTGQNSFPRPEHRQSNLIMSINDLDPAEKKVALTLTELDQMYISLIFSMATRLPASVIWLDFVLRVLDDGEFPRAPYNTNKKKDALVTYTLIRLFEIHKDDTVYRLSRYKKLDDSGKQRIRDLQSRDNAQNFENFISFLVRLSDRFDWYIDDQTPTVPMIKEQKDQDIISTDSSDSDAGSDRSTNDEDDDNEPSSSKKRKRKKLVRNQEAANLRETDQVRIAEQARRRQLLREKLGRLQASGEMGPGSQTTMIINESKRDDQGFIYVHTEIAERIKEHQVSGVRFMWNQIVDAETRQGCLLAHTMGLGKTMQIITLLVTIAQASHSPDATIYSQIPEELRVSRTLILCPSTLVNNWMDELLFWSPEGHYLGPFYKLDSTSRFDERQHTIQNWGARGGILIIGYHLFKRYMKHQHFAKILHENPNIVVADEAHMLKNPRSQLHEATANFKTKIRIALTGSPLANNVEEYYSMINWVANNYLGDPREFRARYSEPIKVGLSIDSTSHQRRKALRMLHVLKSEAAPKVSRITISVLKNDIPTKKEFVLMVPLTPLQRSAYEMYITHRGQEKTSTGTFAATDTLGLICSHPFVFLTKLKELRRIQKNGSINKNAQNGDGSVNVTLPQQLISDEMALLRHAEQNKDVDELTLSRKIPLLFAILEECKKAHDSVLLFSHQIGTLNYLELALRKKKYSFLRLDGKTEMNERQTLVKEFNKGGVDIFLISTSAGGLGLNIVGANRVIIFDVKFNPQEEQQAVGRAYRIGQKKPVFVYRFVCGGTFEEKLLNQAIWKMQLASRVVDKKHPIPKAQPFNEGFDMPEEPEQQDLSEHRNKDAVLDKVLDNYETSIRSITMMDTFEEEALEDAELTPEDRLLANEIIRENEARRLGRPLPHHHGVSGGYENGFQGGQVRPAMHAETFVPGVNWDRWQAFKGELNHAFTKDMTGDEHERRSDISRVLAGRVWGHTEQQGYELRNATRWAIISASSSQRFVEAVCMGIVNPDQLAHMSPAEIRAQQESWDSLNDTAWERYKSSKGPQASNGDPKHLEQVLQRMSSDPGKSHRVDDRRAVEAVMERRKAQQQSSQPTKPSLPSWARDAVNKATTTPKQGHIAPPSSATSSQPTPIPRPPAKDPFNC
ncbi:hypothetical protein F4775DRAFT_587406 [Biscogniauxia sp. FL1348]|nr:hypothetical protein F4775DRAFT_587406 [Biscogniauxia sp. FL1348]